MSEILGGVIIGFTEAAARARGESRSVCEKHILANCAWTADQIKMWSYYRWDDYLTLQRNVIGSLSPERYAVLVANLVRGTAYFEQWVRVMRQFASPLMLYKIVWNWFGPRNFRHVTSRLHVHSSGGVDLFMWMKPGYRDSEEFMCLCADTAIQLPLALGLGPAAVKYRKVDGRSLALTLEPPRSGTVWARVVGLFHRIYAAFTAGELDLSREIIVSHTMAARAEVNFSALFEQAPDAIFITRGDLIVAHNRAAAQIFMNSSGVPRHLVELIQPVQRDVFIQAGRQGVFTLATEQNAVSAPIAEIRYGGRITYGNEDAEFYMVRDVTQLVELRQKVIAGQRFAALGEAAATLTHDLAGPVMIVRGQLEHLASMANDRDGEASSEFDQTINKGLNHLSYIASLVQTYGRFLRGATERSFQFESLVEIVAFALEVCELKAKKADVKLVFIATKPTVVSVACVRHEITQAVVNLINNAIDAAQLTSEKTVAISVDLLVSGDVAISVVDGGRITDPNIVKRMTEPFFTTKADGTGIGLAMTREIAKSHQGRLMIVTEPATKISLVLPQKTRT